MYTDCGSVRLNKPISPTASTAMTTPSPNVSHQMPKIRVGSPNELHTITGMPIPTQNATTPAAIHAQVQRPPRRTRVLRQRHDLERDHRQHARRQVEGESTHERQQEDHQEARARVDAGLPAEEIERHQAAIRIRRRSAACGGRATAAAVSLGEFGEDRRLERGEEGGVRGIGSGARPHRPGPPR